MKITESILYPMAIAVGVGLVFALLFIFRPSINGKSKRVGTPGYASVIWFIFGLAIASFFVGLFVKSIGDHQTTRAWPEVNSTVTYFEHRTSEYEDEDSTLIVQVSYEYEETIYENVSIPNPNSRMYEGQSLTIRVNPDNPWDIYRDGINVWLICAVFFLIGLGLYALGLRGLRGKRAQG